MIEDMCRIISLDNNGNDITCMKTFDTFVNPCDICDISDCPDRVIQIIHATQAATTEEEDWERLGFLNGKFLGERL